MTCPIPPAELKWKAADALLAFALALLAVPLLGFYLLYLNATEQIALAGGFAAVLVASAGGLAQVRRALAFFVGTAALVVFLDFRNSAAPAIKHLLTRIQLVPSAWSHHGDISAYFAAPGNAAEVATGAAAVETAQHAPAAPAWFAWFSALPAPAAQFLSGLALSLLGMAVLLVVALLIGRVYCSVICPLGIFQDAVSRASIFLREKLQGKRVRLPWQPARSTLRNLILAAALLAVLAGWGGFALAWLDPYSHFGRICTEVFRPLLQLENNNLADFYDAHHIPNDAITRTPIPWTGLGALLPPLFFLALVTILAAWRGRLYCNALCPVGTLLGWFSRFALFRVAIDRTSCVRCGECARVCKAQCIDLRTQTVDASRCVACLNCVAICDDHGIRPSLLGKAAPRGKIVPRTSLAKPAANVANAGTSATAGNVGKTVTNSAATPAAAVPAISRRAFLTGTAGVAAAGAAGLAGLSFTAPACNAISPPGAISRQRFLETCTACQLCVSACPSHVLSPAIAEYGTIGGFMKPHMNYTKSFCDAACVRCGEVCPDGALFPLTQDEKKITRIGVAKVTIEKCVVRTNGTACGACAEHCPAAALRMEKPAGGGKFTEPVIYEKLCIGCGACESICPVRPERAVRVHAIPIHEKATIEKSEALKETPATQDFTF